MKLSDLPNIGQVLEKNLIKAGIKNPEELINLGTQKSFKKVKKFYNPESCLNMLYAIEGAVQGIRWHNLPEKKKEELKEFYHSIKNL